jgi:parvulin-like peptidyl-prolyl isomerase
MKSQTARRPERPGNQRSARSTKSKKYVKQTAHVEARRDGTPLIFGWGGHLSRSEKTRLERRAIWFAAIAFFVLIVVVLVGYWVNLNVIVPGLPITSVNGQAIPQSDYRKLVAVNTQYELNRIYGPHGLIAQRDNLKLQADNEQKTIDSLTKQIDDLNNQIKALPAGSSTQRTDLTNQMTGLQAQLKTAQSKHDDLIGQYTNMLQNTIPNEQQLFTQSQVGNDSADWLQDDVFIRQWLTKQNSAIQAKVQPSTSAVNQELNNFIANMPKTTSYSKFLSQDNVSDADVRAMIALKLRRDNMQNYLASQITSPAYQVLARAMTIDTQQHAEDVLNQLKHGADFGKLASQKSVDTNTNKKGGDLGWLARGQYAITEAANQSAVVDNWIFDPARKLNELSPVLNENGSYHIVQIMGIDPSRPIDPTTLQSLQQNALLIWILEQKAQPGVTVTPIDQNKLTDSSNMPPDLPAAAPAATPPGGLPGSGIPGAQQP